MTNVSNESQIRQVVESWAKAAVMEIWTASLRAISKTW
jgi:hypothetical protein